MLASSKRYVPPARWVAFMVRPALFLILLWLVTGDFSTAAATQSLSGHVPQAVKIGKAIGKPAPETQLGLAIGLPLRNQQSLSNLLVQIYDPKSPQYHKYLTPDQFTAMFGPTEEDYQQLKDFAQRKGLKVAAEHPNRMLLDVRGSVAQIEKALHLTIRLYEHPTEARNFYAPENEPTLDTDIRVLHISGLDNFVTPRPASMKMRPLDRSSGATPQGGSGPSGTYRGADFKNAYAPVALTGTGQMVGLLEFDRYYPNDIALYATQASLSPVPPRIDVFLDEIQTALPTPGSGNVEVALDIEMAICMASGLSAVIVYQGLDGNDILNRMATDNLAKQLSASWTFGIDATTPQIFQEFAAQGQTYFNASGDGDAYSGAIANPVDQPFVTSVGGTTLTTTGPFGSYVSETTWNWGRVQNQYVGTGGGISTTIPIPSYQAGTSMASNQGSTTMRNVPDVAIIADNVYVVANNGSGSSVGGTSIGAPLWAAYIALVNQQATSLGQPPVGFLNPVVYAIGSGPGYSTNFHDITTGDNTSQSSPTKFFAVTNYDLCTGVGSPIGNKLINTLAPRANSILITTSSSLLFAESCQPATGAVDPNETVTFAFSLKNIGGIATTNLVATLQASGGVLAPSAPQTYGTLNGGGSAVSRQFTFTAGGTCGGTVNATLQLQDGVNPVGNVTFSFPLGKPVTTFSQNFDSATRPFLPSGWSTAVSGGGVAWVTSTTLKDSSPNAVFASEPTNIGITELNSPIIPITSSNAQLIFRHDYNSEIDPVDVTRAYDGGLLEISISNGPFVDILAAGGSFATNGYNRTISATNDNPFAGRQAWSGLSSNFVTTVVNLPTSAAGQNIQLKWRFGTDSGNAYGSSGWYIDGVTVNDGYTCCSSTADFAISQAPSTNLVILGQNLTYSLSVSNLGSQPVSSVSITDAIPANVTFSSASPGCIYTNGIVICTLGAMNAGDSNGVTVTVTPVAAGLVTNLVSVGSTLPDPFMANNFSTNVVSVTANNPPIFTLQPTNVIVAQGGNATFLASASGVPAPSYQWLFNGGNISGATTTLLSLNNAQATNIGNYQAVATNSAGSVTSSVAHLTVLIAPSIRLGSIGANGTNVTISVNSVAGLTYRLEYKNLLTDPLWTPIAPAAAGTGAAMSLVDTNTPLTPTRFYRVSAF